MNPQRRTQQTSSLRLPHSCQKRFQRPLVVCWLCLRPLSVSIVFLLLVVNWETGKYISNQIMKQMVLESRYEWTNYSTRTAHVPPSRYNNPHPRTNRFIEDGSHETIYHDESSLLSSSSSSSIARIHLERNDEEDNMSWMASYGWQNKSSVDYFGCCGAGHRLSRTANAYYIARHVLNFGLRVYWRFCGTMEVYSTLFQPQPLEELRNVTSMNENVYFHNEIPGFVSFSRYRPLVNNNNNATAQRHELNHTNNNHNNNTRKIIPKPRRCPCPMDKIQSDAEFYAGLRHRYRFKNDIDQFVDENFRHASLRIGLHIRAGNNETGDFELKGRGIQNRDAWTSHVAGHLQRLIDTWKMNEALLHQSSSSSSSSSSSTNNTSITTSTTTIGKKKIVLFLASDTPSMFSTFRSLLVTSASSPSSQYLVNVVEYPQERLREGAGVLFGESQAGHMDDGMECLKSWKSIFADLFLLSHVDILVAPRSSSFTQTLPMSLVFANRLERQQQQQQQQQRQQQQHGQIHPLFPIQQSPSKDKSIHRRWVS